MEQPTWVSVYKDTGVNSNRFVSYRTQMYQRAKPKWKPTTWVAVLWDRQKRNINNLRYADDTTLMAEQEEELKSLLMREKEECEKVGLKVNIQKTKIMASDPITSWQIDGGKVGTVANFIWGGLQNHCGWWLQPQNEKMLVPWKKSHDLPRQHIKKQKHHFANKDP